MKTQNFLIIMGISVIMSLIMIQGCQKDKFNSRIKVNMTDGPGIYEEVNIDIKQVEIHYNSDGPRLAGWLNLKTNARIYNLIELQNGVTAVLADDARLPSGHVTQMRLILGGRNTVVTGGVEYNLDVPSSENTGLKINIDMELYPNSGKEILLDFDAEKSIVVNGDGTYSLQPVIQIKSIVSIER